MAPMPAHHSTLITGIGELVTNDGDRRAGSPR